FVLVRGYPQAADGLVRPEHGGLQLARHHLDGHVSELLLLDPPAELLLLDPPAELLLLDPPVELLQLSGGLPVAPLLRHLVRRDVRRRAAEAVPARVRPRGPRRLRLLRRGARPLPPEGGRR